MREMQQYKLLDCSYSDWAADNSLSVGQLAPLMTAPPTNCIIVIMVHKWKLLHHEAPESQLLGSPGTDNSLSEIQLAGSTENTLCCCLHDAHLYIYMCVWWVGTVSITTAPDWGGVTIAVCQNSSPALSQCSSVTCDKLTWRSLRLDD